MSLPPKTDRRSERSRTLLLQSLPSLMAERGYERLTIQDVLDHAGVGRTTFYAHFESKDDLLTHSIAGLRAWLQAEWRAAPGERLGFSGPFFRHLDSHRGIYRHTIGRPSETTVERHIRAMLLSLAQADPAIRRTGAAAPLAAEVAIGCLWAVIRWWIESRSALGADEANALFQRLAFGGLDAMAGAHGA